MVYKEVEKPALKPGWSLIKVKGFGINHSELFTRQGHSPSVEFPRILGIECVGTIEETTDEERLPVGRKVISIMGEMGRAFDGSYAEYVLVPNTQIYLLDSELSWEKLAAIPETYYTAYGSFKNLQIKATDKVLVRGASSGVGIACLQLLKGKHPAIHVTGSTRSQGKGSKLRAIGFDQVIQEENGVLQTDDTFDKIVELIGPATLKNSFQHINENGIICSTGQLGGQWYLDTFDPIMDIKHNGYLTSFYSGVVDQTKLTDLFKFVEQYKIMVQPDKIFKLSDVPEAHRYLESSHSFGKVVVLTD